MVLYQGTTLVVPKKANKIAGFSPWGTFLHRPAGFMQPAL